MVLANAQAPEGKRRENPNPWLLLDAADTLFETAKRRVYTGKIPDRKSTTMGSSSPPPDAVHPVLEELPKWEMLAEVLAEVERDYYFSPVPQDDSSGAILVMCGDLATCSQLREYLQTMHVQSEEPKENDDKAEQSISAAFMLRRKIRGYIQWKRNFTRITASLEAENEKPSNGPVEARGVQSFRGRAPINKRRRVRGTSSAASAAGRMDFGARTAGDRDSHMAHLLDELRVTEAEAQQKE